MTTVVRYARMYWRLNELAWQQLRKVAVPLLILFAVAAGVIGFVGGQAGHPELVWVPIWYAAALSISVSLARLQ